jgi:DeoR/GlpR family transcriptional regulator of sugar metabolism
MTCAAVHRSHKIVALLAGRYFDGVSNKELAESIGTSPANISRDMAVLEDIGYARKLDNGLWSLTSKPLGIMQSYQNHYIKLQNRMVENTRNIGAAAAREGA